MLLAGYVRVVQLTPSDFSTLRSTSAILTRILTWFGVATVIRLTTVLLVSPAIEAARLRSFSARPALDTLPLRTSELSTEVDRDVVAGGDRAQGLAHPRQILFDPHGRIQQNLVLGVDRIEHRLARVLAVTYIITGDLTCTSATSGLAMNTVLAGRGKRMSEPLPASITIGGPLART